MSNGIAGILIPYTREGGRREVGGGRGGGARFLGGRGASRMGWVELLGGERR